MEDGIRYCNNCGTSSCLYCTTCSAWSPKQPKEKPMENKIIKNEGINTNSIGIYENLENKVIFESEEEAKIAWRLTANTSIDSYVDKLRQKGYIRKSPVKEAEDYEKHIAGIMDNGLNASIKDLEWSMRIIRELKAENERLKG